MDKKKKPALPAEIIGQIYGFIQDLGTLSTCTRISKIWGKEATRILWGSRDKPQDRATALLAIGDFQRRQSLAESIVSLDFESPDSDHRSIEVKYPKLEEISLALSTHSGTTQSTEDECYLQYLQPALRSIVLYSSTCFDGFESPDGRGHGRHIPGDLSTRVSPSDFLLHEISHRCSNLRNISLQLPYEFEAMAEFLDASTKLEQVILTPNCDDSRPWAEPTEYEKYTGLFIALSKLPHLNHLQWPTMIDGSKVQAVQEQTATPFSSLLHLKSRMEPGAFGPLLAILPGLKVLDALVGQQGLEDTDDRDDNYNYADILSPIAQCHNLEALELYLSVETGIDGHLFMQIPSNCSNLKVLRINNYGDTRINLSSAEMNTFATSLPKLRQLEVYGTLHFEASDLRLFAGCCSDLEECIVDYMDLLSLRTGEPPLFPNLRTLHLSSGLPHVTEADELAASQHIDIIKYHMPRLEDFLWDSDDDLERDVNRGLIEWTASKKGSN